MCVFRYRLAGLPGDYQEKNISSPETNYCLLKDLIIWTQYQIQVAAYTGAGLGIYSRPVTEYTLQGGRWRCTRTFSFLIYTSHSKYTEHFQSSLHTERHCVEFIHQDSRACSNFSPAPLCLEIRCSRFKCICWTLKSCTSVVATADLTDRNDVTWSTPLTCF